LTRWTWLIRTVIGVEARRSSTNTPRMGPVTVLAWKFSVLQLSDEQLAFKFYFKENKSSEEVLKLFKK
jgi:hypothetical protein